MKENVRFSLLGLMSGRAGKITFSPEVQRPPIGGRPSRRGKTGRPAKGAQLARSPGGRFSLGIGLQDEIADALLAAASTMGRSSAKLRRSPLIEY
jgi:hypothetical protein